MEKNWFECRISYDKTMDDGQVKRVTEDYLVEATGFTEAEKRITEEMVPFISGDFTIGAIRRRNYEMVMTSEYGYMFFRVKLVITTIDEKTAAEKHTNMFLLVEENDLLGAVREVNDHLSGSMMDWEYHTISQTSILDVFRSDDVEV